MQLVSLTFSSHISKNEWEVKPTPQFDYRRMRTKFYNILWDLGNLKIRGKFCNIFHLKILRIMFLDILYLRHPIHFIILPPHGTTVYLHKSQSSNKTENFYDEAFYLVIFLLWVGQTQSKMKIGPVAFTDLELSRICIWSHFCSHLFKSSCFAFHFFAEQI